MLFVDWFWGRQIKMLQNKYIGLWLHLNHIKKGKKQREILQSIPYSDSWPLFSKMLTVRDKKARVLSQALNTEGTCPAERGVGCWCTPDAHAIAYTSVCMCVCIQSPHCEHTHTHTMVGRRGQTTPPLRRWVSTWNLKGRASRLLDTRTGPPDTAAFLWMMNCELFLESVRHRYWFGTINQGCAVGGS